MTSAAVPLAVGCLTIPISAGSKDFIDSAICVTNRETDLSWPGLASMSLWRRWALPFTYLDVRRPLTDGGCCRALMKA